MSLQPHLLTLRVLLGAGCLMALSCQPSSSDDSGGDDATNGSAPVAEDADEDGILDSVEGQGDSDGDGTPDYLDTDSDGDCIPDAIERGDLAPYSLPIDTDLDGTPDYLDLDSDDNTIDDTTEVGDCNNPADLDGDGLGNQADFDDDGDLINDIVEGFGDFDGDGPGNYRDTDSDGDCIDDIIEAGDRDPDTDPVDTDGDGSPDFLDIDSDNDGVSDLEEVDGICSDVADTDGDGSADYVDDDIDGDGLTNDQELAIGTDPWVRDTDEDGFTDGLEDYAGTSPLLASSQPRGTLIETGPRQVSEHEGEYILDEYQLDIFVLLDTAYSYSCYHPNLQEFIEDLVDRLFAEFEDLALGFGTYDDYRWGIDWTASSGHPYEMVQQVTTNETLVLNAARGQAMVYGGDDEGSAYEALYQAATGHAYDQVCDHIFQDQIDVKPFVSSEDDAFDGKVRGTYRADIEGSGDRGGSGFRAGSSPIFILTADNTIRNAENGHEVPTGTCDQIASFDMATQAVNELHARILGVNVYEYQSYDDTLQQQLVDLALATGSFIDSDDDGAKDDPAVLFGSWQWPDLDLIVDALWDMAEEMDMDISFRVSEDENGWITSFEPGEDEVFNIDRGEGVGYYFDLSTAAQTLPDDQFYHARVDVLDDGDLADYDDIWVLIRPETVN